MAFGKPAFGYTWHQPELASHKDLPNFYLCATPNAKLMPTEKGFGMLDAGVEDLGRLAGQVRPLLSTMVALSMTGKRSTLVCSKNWFSMIRNTFMPGMMIRSTLT